MCPVDASVIFESRATENNTRKPPRSESPALPTSPLTYQSPTAAHLFLHATLLRSGSTLSLASFRVQVNLPVRRRSCSFWC